MPSRERRLLDKDIEIRKLKGELKHYKSCYFVAVMEKEEMKRKFEMANGELNYIQKQVDKDQNLAKVENLRKKLKIACETLKRIGANYPRMTDLYRMKLANDAIEQLTKGAKDDK